VSRERFRRIAEVFEAASALPPGDARDSYLREAAGGDEEVRREVEALLAADERIGDTTALDRIGSGVAASAAAFLEAFEATPERIGPYRILGRLGAGGMGVVFRAEQENPRRIVALKVISPGSIAPSALRRFEFEAQVLARLQHPGIAPVYEAGVAEGPFGGRIPWFAMELIEGRPLVEFARAERLGLRERLELFARVCDAVHHAHQKGVIHRDLKPQNILVRDGSPRPGEPKILDFGVARAISPEDRPGTIRTIAGQLVGTLPYMSPEQVGGDPDAIDIRTDVYSLGVILHELLSGRLPIDPGTAAVPKAMLRILEEEPDRLGRLDPDLRGDVETIVAKTLEKDPARRYGSAAELGADLRRTLRDEPISARPTSRVYLLGKFARRNRAVVVATSLVILALLAGLVAERGQRRRAERAMLDLEHSRGETESANRDLEAKNLELAEALRGAERVTRFLCDLFGAANPTESGGREITVREKFTEAEGRLAEFSDQPAIEARVRNAVGEVLFGLGEYRLAKAHLERAAALRRGLVGEDHPETARSHLSLATVLLALEERQEGKRFAELAFRTFREHLGIGAEETLLSLGAIASAGESLGDPGARAKLEEVFELWREHFGPDHPRTISAESNLALRLQKDGFSSEAEPHFHRVLAARRAEYGDRHPMTAIALNNLGYLLNETRRYPEALPYLVEAHRVAVETLGEGHPRTLLYGNNLGVSYFALERYDEARPFFEAAAEKCRKELGPEHPNTLLARGNVAGLMRKSGDREGAAALLPEIVAGLRRALSPGHPVVARYARIEGLTLFELERFAEAEPLLLESHRILLAAHGPDHISTREAREALVALYEAWGRLDDAAPWRAPGSDATGGEER